MRVFTLPYADEVRITGTVNKDRYHTYGNGMHQQRHGLSAGADSGTVSPSGMAGDKLSFEFRGTRTGEARLKRRIGWAFV